MVVAQPLTTRVVKLVSEFRRHSAAKEYGNDPVAVVEVATEVGWSILCFAEWVGFQIIIRN